MKNIFKLLFIIFILLQGCATYIKPVEHKFDRTIEIDKSYDAAWIGIIKYFSSKNIPIKTIEKNSGIIVSDNLSISLLKDEQNFDCGKFSKKDAIGNFYTGKASFNIFIEQLGLKKSKITINTVAEINHLQQGIGYTQFSCYSTGNFEKSLIEFIKKN